MKKFLSILIILFVSSFVFAEQRYASVRIRDWSFTKGGSGESVIKLIKENIGNKKVSCFTYDSKQECIIIVYEN